MVGVGKTTISNLLAKELKIPVLEEPFDANPYLPLSYSNPKDWAFENQVQFLIDKCKLLHFATNNGPYILDRSPLGDLAFINLFKELGYLTSDEKRIYDDLWDRLISKYNEPKVIIHLDRPIDDILRNIEHRNREFEVNKSRKYWEDLNRHTKENISKMRESGLRVETFNLEGLDIKNPSDRSQLIYSICNSI